MEALNLENELEAVMPHSTPPRRSYKKPWESNIRPSCTWKANLTKEGPLLKERDGVVAGVVKGSGRKPNW